MPPVLLSPIVKGNMEVHNIFGPKRDWEDLRRILADYLWKRFWDISPDDVADAASAAMVDLMDRWIDYPTSVTNDVSRNWSYAMWRAKHTASNFLGKLLEERGVLWSYDAIDEEDGPDWLESIEDPTPLTPNEERNEAIRQALGEMPEEELRKSLYPVLMGESERQQARREKSNKSAVHNCRVLGRTHFWDLLLKGRVY